MPYYRKNMTIFLMYSQGDVDVGVLQGDVLEPALSEKNQFRNWYILQESLENFIAYEFIWDWLDSFFSQILTGYWISGFFLPDIRLDRIPDFTTIRPDSSFDFLSIFPDDFFLSEIKNTIRRDTGYPAGYRISGWKPDIRFSKHQLFGRIQIVKNHNPAQP